MAVNMFVHSVNTKLSLYHEDSTKRIW